MNIYLITGATGLVGKALCKLCNANNIKIHYLTTNKDKIQNTPLLKGFLWNPSKGEIDDKAFNGVKKIIHLAGANVAVRWSKAHRKNIIDSRVMGTHLLLNTVNKLQVRIDQFISASAIGTYPSSRNINYTEKNKLVADNFLGEVVKDWEEAADAFTTLNIGVTKVRIGLILDREQGAFPKMINPIRWGTGACFGDGKQWQSWIHIDDIAGIFLHLAEEQITGTYNAVAPKPITQQTLIDIAAKKLKRPLLLPNIPTFVCKIIFGKMSSLLLDSHKVSSTKISETGFNFKYTDINKALDNLIQESTFSTIETIQKTTSSPIKN